MMDDGMPETSGVDARKLALEVMATLVNVKRIAADRILRPAGIPDVLIKRFLKGKDVTTGETLTKRQAGALILEELARDGNDSSTIRKLIDIAASWNAYDLAQDEYKARAVVQKARELRGALAEADARRLKRSALFGSARNDNRKNEKAYYERKARFS